MEALPVYCLYNIESHCQVKMYDVALTCVIHDALNESSNHIRRYFPIISNIYNNMYAVVSSETHEDVISALQDQGIQVHNQKGPRAGLIGVGDARRQALQVSIEDDNKHTHLVEVDRLLQWVSSYPDELRKVVRRIPEYDFLVIGRTPRAFNSHTRCQVETESLANKVISLLVGQELDYLVSCRGISKRAGEVIIDKSIAKNVGTDSEWPIIIKCCTDFPIDYVQVEGLEFELAFRYPERVREAGGLEAMKTKRDTNPESWLHRIRAAEQICSTAISTYQAFNKLQV